MLLRERCIVMYIFYCHNIFKDNKNKKSKNCFGLTANITSQEINDLNNIPKCNVSYAK